MTSDDLVQKKEGVKNTVLGGGLQKQKAFRVLSDEGAQRMVLSRLLVALKTPL